MTDRYLLQTLKFAIINCKTRGENLGLRRNLYFHSFIRRLMVTPSSGNSLAPPIPQDHSSQRRSDAAPVPTSTADLPQQTFIEEPDDDAATIAADLGTELEEGDPTDVVKARDGKREDSELSQPPKEEKPLSFAQKVWKWTKAVLQLLLDQWFVLGVGFVIVSLAKSGIFFTSLDAETDDPVDDPSI